MYLTMLPLVIIILFHTTTSAHLMMDKENNHTRELTDFETSSLSALLMAFRDSNKVIILFKQTQICAEGCEGVHPFKI